MTQTIKTTPKGNKWTRRATRQKESRMIVNSGATSHFVTEDMNLPKTGPSNKMIYLPNNTTIKASAKTMLPFNQLMDKAREAEILPGLKRPLMSVNTMPKESYTTFSSRRRRRHSTQTWNTSDTHHRQTSPYRN